MGPKALIYLLITVFSTLFGWIGTFFGGGVFGIPSLVLGTVGCFVGIWVWYKFFRNM